MTEGVKIKIGWKFMSLLLVISLIPLTSATVVNNTGFFGAGSEITGILGSRISNDLNWLNSTTLGDSETDPFWSANYSTYLTLFNWNKTYADTLYYPLSSNPSGYLTSYTETDPLWTANYSDFLLAYGLATNGTFYLASNPFGFYNSTTLPDSSYNDTWINNTFFNKTQILDFGYYNITDFDIDDYLLISNWNATNVSYATLSELNNGTYVISSVLNNGTYLNTDTFVANYSGFLSIGNWTADKGSYALLSVLNNGSYLNTEVVDSFAGNYSTFLTHINWSVVTNGTLAFAADLNNGSYFNNFNINDYTLLTTLNNGSYLNIAETDPFWSANYSDFLLAYGLATNGTFYLNSNPINFINGTYANSTYLLKSEWNATNTSYYLASNPFGFYNSTTLTTNSQLANGNNYWNDTYATFNKTYADTLYATASSSVTGSGTEGYIPLWNGTTSLNNSVIYQNGSNIGIGTTSPNSSLHVKNGAFLIEGTTGETPFSGIGTRFMWIPSKSAFRAGFVSGFFAIGEGHEPDDIGLYSTALGWDTTASGLASFSTGIDSIASGNHSAALGFDVISKAYSSVAVGSYNLGLGTNNSWVETDPIFEVGIGIDLNNRKNALTILKNGNSGIGTAFPQRTLHVNGSVLANGTINSTVDICIEGGNCLSGVSGGAETDPFWSANYSNVAFENQANVFGAFNQSFNTNTLFIDAGNGRVGIGTVTPGWPLTVAGSIISTTGNVEAAGGDLANQYGPVHPYKVYTAGISQTSSNAPVEDFILQDTLGSISYGYTNIGQYTITSGGADFIDGKTFILLSGGGGADSSLGRVYSVVAYRFDDSTIKLETGIPGGDFVDEVLYFTSIEIRVYD